MYTITRETIRRNWQYCDVTVAGELKHGKGNVTEEMTREECDGYEIVVLGDEKPEQIPLISGLVPG